MDATNTYLKDFYVVGVMLILLGFLLIMYALFKQVQAENSEASSNVEVGVIGFIGFIPVVFATSKRALLMAFVILLAMIFFVLMFLMRK